MNKRATALTGAVLAAVLVSASMFGQSSPPNAVRSATETMPDSQLLQVSQEVRAALKVIDKRLGTIEKLDGRLKSIENKVEPPSMLRKIGEDFVSNFLWEAFNFKKGTHSRVAQMSAALGVILTLLRLYFFVRDRRRGLSKGRTVAEIGTVAYLLIITLVLGALVHSGGFLQEEQSGVSDIAGMRKELRALRSSVDELRSLPTIDVLARVATLNGQMKRLETQMTTRETLQLASVANAVANTRDHTAAFWLQVIEFIAVLATTFCVGIIFYDKFLAS